MYPEDAVSGNTMSFEPETVWEFSMADVTFGVGAVAELGAAVRERGAESVMVVTDPGVEAAGIVETVTAELDGVDVSVFADVEPDPPLELFEAAADRTATADPDAVVAVGGGSSMDVAKTASIVAEHGGDVLDYVAPPTGGGTPVPGPGIPTVAVPTTSGTGSETSPVSVLSLPGENLKVGISSRHQRPDLALVDPALTVSLPPRPTAASGIDALAHAVEAYVTRRYDAKAAAETPADRPDYNGRTPLTDSLALTAIELVGENLRDAVNNGEDLAARRNMALGSFLAGATFTNAGLGVCHAMAMAAGAQHHTPHGETIAATLPAVVEFNAPGAADRYATVAERLGADAGDRDRAEAAETAARAVERLADDVGLGGGLSRFGVTEDDVESLASKAAQLERLVVGNPRRATEADFESLFRASL